MTEQEEINICLNCILPDCVNCLSKGGKRYFKTLDRMERIRQYAKLGFTDKEMAALMGCCSLTVSRLRNSMGIPPSRGGVRVGRPRKTEGVQNSVRKLVD